MSRAEIFPVKSPLPLDPFAILPRPVPRGQQQHADAQAKMEGAAARCSPTDLGALGVLEWAPTR
jgi:hypothetical protein